MALLQMKKPGRQFEIVPVTEALRASMKSAAQKLRDTKTEPYAIVVKRARRAPNKANDDRARRNKETGVQRRRRFNEGKVERYK